MNVLLLILTGLTAGVLSGLGLGGGIILIPALTLIFGKSQHVAQNINLIYFIPTAAFAIFVHLKNKQMQTKILPKIVIGGLLGAVAGSLIALKMEGDVLRQIFAVFLFAMGIMEFFKKSKKPENIGS